LYITGRSKDIIFINGQNYYPHDLENIAQRAPGLDLNKVVTAGAAKPGAQGEELVVFVLHRGDLPEFLPTVAAVNRLINEHTGIEVSHVIPVKRIPKTTSGKVNSTRTSRRSRLCGPRTRARTSPARSSRRACRRSPRPPCPASASK
jgi:surfactin family lipopeptide synthetase A